jgi:HSP20 family protein
MNLIKWDPSREVETLQGEMNRMFDNFFGYGSNGQRRARWAPAMDLSEKEEHFILHLDLPGLNENDVNIEVKERLLTISGERRFEQESTNKGYHRVERAFGSFSRSITLPQGIEAEEIKANFDRGVLEVIIPKPREEESQKIAIEVKDSDPKQIDDHSDS